MKPKVIIEQRILRRSDAIQLVALVYFGTDKFSIYAPERAAGDPLGWIEQLFVHASRGDGDYDVPSHTRHLVIEAMVGEFERSKGEAAQAEADAFYREAQICRQGDVQSSDGTPFNSAGYCTKCGAECIHRCLHCKAGIRGKKKGSAAEYEVPSFCHRCGNPYPWMEDKLKTAHDLLFHDDKLSYEDRKELWELMRYVMSNPKADLAPAKSKLIMIRIEKAAGPIRDFVTDVLAKYGAEMSK